MAANRIEAGLRIKAGVEGTEDVGKLAEELKATGVDAGGLTQKFDELQSEFADIGKQQALIESFKGIKREFKETDIAIAALKQEQRKLKTEMDGDGTKAQQKRLADLKAEVNSLHGRKRALGNQLTATRAGMDAAGITTQTLAKREQELAAQSDAARAKMAALGGEMQALKAKSAAAALDVDKLGKGLTPIGSSVMSMGSSMAAVAGVGGGLFALKQGLSSVIDTTLEFKAIRSRMEYAFGGASQAAEQMDWVRGVAQELGLEIKSMANGYAQLASATKNIGMSTQQTQTVFKGVASAAASMNLSVDETNGVLLALSQIAGKGKVSMEELRGQLGERLTPAMAIAAKSMGVTTAELEKMVESGIAAEDFLPKFGAAMEQAFGGVESAGASVNRLKNQFSELLLKIGEEGGVFDAYNKIVGEIGNAMSMLESKIESLDGTLTGGMADAFSGAYELIKEGGAEVADMFNGLMGIVNDVGGAFAALAGVGDGEFDIIKGIVDGLNISIGALRDGIAGIGIAFDTLAGTAMAALAKIAEGMAKITFGEISAGFAAAAAQLSASADEHFGKAHAAAMDFESKAAQAVERAMETESQRFARLEQEAKAAYDKAAAAAKEAAEKSKDAHERAAQAVGTSQEQATKKAAEEADKVAAAAQKSAASAEKDWEKAFTRMGGSAEELEKLKHPLEGVGDVAKKAGGDIEDIGKKAEAVSPKVAAAFKELGVDANAATTGISSDAQEAFGKWQAASDAMREAGTADARLVRSGFEQMMGKLKSGAEFEAFKQQLKDSGDAALLTKDQLDRLNRAAEEGAGAAKTAYAELSETIKKAAGTEEISRLGDAAKQAMREGTISAAEYDQAMQQLKARQQELEAAERKKGEEAQAANAKAEASARKAAGASREQESAVKGVADAHKAAGAEAEKASIRATVAGKSALDQATLHADAVGKLRENLKANAVQLMGLGTSVSGSFEALKRYNQYFNNMKSALVEAAQATDMLSAKTSAGTVTLQDIAFAAGKASSRFGDLDKTTLANLNRAIDAARAKIQALADEAADTRKQLEADLASLRGDDGKVAALEQEKALRELNLRLSEAQAAQNTQAMAEYQRSIALQQQIYAEKQRQAAVAKEEAARQAAAAKAQDSGNAGNSSAAVDLPPVSAPNTSAAARQLSGAIQQAILARDKELVDKAISGLVGQLQEEAKRMGK